MSMEKTNVMRILDKANVEYTPHEYNGGIVNGVEVANALGEDPDCVFKTLVTVSEKNINYVFIVPVRRELNLKKAAKAVGAKSIAMIKQKELLPLTGYIHGGCSPLGMKKQFRTVIDETAQLFEKIYFSAGKVGYQIETSPSSLFSLIPIEYADICD